MTAGDASAPVEWDFFVSYHGSDEAWAVWIAWQLEAAGYRVLVQAWDMVPGTNWAERMQTGLTRSHRMIAVLSPAYLQFSRFGAAEWQTAWTQDPDGALRRVIPVRVAECDRPGLLTGLVGIDLFDIPEPVAAARLQHALASAIAGRAKPSMPPAFPRPNDTVTAMPPQPPFPAGLPAVWNMPLRNPNFTGRTTDLTALRTGLATGSSTMTVQALRGMGGIGKTQLAIEYAHRYAGDYDLVWWFNTGHGTAMADQVTSLAVALGLKPVTDPEAMLRTVQRALRHREDWLLIFDNAETQDQVRPLLPGGVGHVLITTRRDGFRALGGVLDLDLMGRPDAITLLRRRCPTLTTTDADRLAERLGDLPLALDQAAAYLDHSGMAPEDYLTLLDTRGGELLARGEVGTYPHSVTTVWSLSLDRLQETTPAAVDLLGLCAWLAPEPIPLDLFTTHPELLPRHLAETTSDLLAFTDTVAALTDYALARRTTDGLILHRLVQDITRQRISDAGGWAPLLQTVLPLLREALPDNVWYQPATWPVYRRLLPHVLTATGLAGDHPKDPGTTAWLLNQAGRYLRRMGQADNALPLHQRALAILEAMLGPDHPDVAWTLDCVGWALAVLGRNVEALHLQERALAIRETVHGPGHPDVATSLNRVGWVLTSLGRPAEALPHLQRALTIREAAFGPDHPNIAIDLNDLGRVLSALGRPAEALPLQQRALTIHEAAFGPDHPNIATDLDYVGQALTALGQPAEALPLHQRALTIHEAAFGPDHPNIAATLNDVGRALSALGRPAEALPLHQRALTIHEAAFGPDHPDVAATLNDVGRALSGVARPSGGPSCGS